MRPALLGAALLGGAGLAAAEHRRPESRVCDVFCVGPLLDTIQLAHVFNDSKTFVDMPLTKDPEDVIAAFNAIDRHNLKALSQFLKENFGKEGEDLQNWTPPDWAASPPALMALTNTTKRDWALEIHKLWKVLGRKQVDAVTKTPQRFTLLPRENGFIIPGGRFRENYYWDTYWIVRGLIDSDMVETARGMVDNLLADVKSFGFVPNGGRAYYLDRSQPPMLTSMVLAVFEAKPDAKWLAAVAPVLEAEYDFWMNTHVTYVRMGRNAAVLNKYTSPVKNPRPESYREDVETAVKAEKKEGVDPEDVFRGLRSAAESGWDFSSRWTLAAEGGSSKVWSADGSSVVPVDLNSVMYATELGLARIKQTLGQNTAKYNKAASDRRDYMNAVLWDHEEGRYRDLVKATGEFSEIMSVSDFAVPLWAGLYGVGDKAKLCSGAGCEAWSVRSLKQSGLLQPGGALTTTMTTHQQWDSPNAWAPLQLMLVEGLDKMKAPGSKELANQVAQDFLENCLVTWQKTGAMHEKYNAIHPGTAGGGGEYVQQIGFGWTNGVALALMIRENKPAVDTTVVFA